MRRYLLGLLPEAEAEMLEDAYLAQPEFWSRVRGVEHDLLDDYAAGRLADAEKEAFESRYLASPALRERVVAARALRLAATGSPVPAQNVGRARAARWALPVAVAAGLILSLLSEWSGSARQPYKRPAVASAPSPAMSAEPQTRPSAAGSSPAPATSLPPHKPSERLVVLALSPVLLRGEERPAEQRIPAGTDALLLELEGDPAPLPAPPSALEAMLETVEGEPVWRGEARRATALARPGLLASARVPAAKLAPGDYLLTLSVRGSADGTVHRYFIRVRR